MHDERIRDAFRHFDPKPFLEGGPSETTRVALMRVEDFLRLAAPVSTRIDSASRFAAIDACLAAGTPFATPLELILEFDEDDGETRMNSHDGRHRAMRLAGRVDLVPVHIVMEGFAGDPPADVWDRLDVIHPEPHDDDDEYPGFDDDELWARQDPVRAKDVFVSLHRVDEVLAILGLERDAAPVPLGS